MTRLPVLTPDSARGAAQDMLADLVARNGQVGTMVRTMANSPSVLGGYLQLSRAMKRAKLDRRISERISIAVQAHQECQSCLDSHIAAARSLGLDDGEIEKARRGTSSDPTIAGIVAFGLQVHVKPSAITTNQVDDLRSAGFSNREISDVVGVVALNVITGAFNLVAGLDINAPQSA